LNGLTYSNNEIEDIQFLNILQTFKPENVYNVKKFQKRTTLSDKQIILFGKYIGKDFKKLVKFKLSVRGNEVPKDIKGPQIGKVIQAMEKEKFLNEISDKAKLYKLYTKAMKMMPGSSDQKKVSKEIDKLRKKLGINEIAVRKTPKKFKDIFNALPSDLRKRVYNLKKYDQRRDKHPEGNVLKHTIAVTNRALKTGDIDFALAALFHDIGKDETAGIHPKHGYITHWGHEHVSAKLVKKYGKWIKSMGGNVLDIYWMVKQHMRMKVFDKMRWEKQEKMKKFRAFGKLKRFSKDFDKGGRR
jgi:putative nucleotidyltransferase with HDIG domain